MSIRKSYGTFFDGLEISNSFSQNLQLILSTSILSNLNLSLSFFVSVAGATRPFLAGGPVGSLVGRSHSIYGNDWVDSIRIVPNVYPHKLCLYAIEGVTAIAAR